MKWCELCEASHPDDVEQCECGSFCFTGQGLDTSPAVVSESDAPRATRTMAGDMASTQESVPRARVVGWGLVAALAAGGLLVLKWLLEQIAQDFAKALLAPTGNLGYGLLFVLIGMGLLVGGPLYMNGINRQRLKQERRPKYRLLEKSIVVAGGVVFTTAGIVFLIFRD